MRRGQLRHSCHSQQQLGSSTQPRPEEVEWALFRPLHRRHSPTARLTALLQMAERHYDQDRVGVLLYRSTTSASTLTTNYDHGGTLTTLVWFARRIGADCSARYHLQAQTRSVSLFWQTSGASKKGWQHDVREFLHVCTLSLLASRRRQFEGV